MKKNNLFSIRVGGSINFSLKRVKVHGLLIYKRVSSVIFIYGYTNNMIFQNEYYRYESVFFIDLNKIFWIHACRSFFEARHIFTVCISFTRKK